MTMKCYTKQNIDFTIYKMVTNCVLQRAYTLLVILSVNLYKKCILMLYFK